MNDPNQPSSSSSRLRELFLEALEKRLPAERRAFLEAACGGDRELRESVESLLAHHHDDNFLEESPAGIALTGSPALPGILPDEMSGGQIGRYKLLEKLGEGGCGVVYMAAQEEPVRRLVALKVIKLGMDTRSVIARFEAERQALAMMDHPNIARVLDAGATSQGRPYFVMELVRGTRITQYCEEHHLPVRDRLDLFVSVCQALQHAHQKGIIHRDIKPSNILVTSEGGVALPKVIDFGIAKATTDQRLTDKTIFTALEQFLGTPAYMSPEQAGMSGMDVDTRCDIYSLGVLLYELLAGTPPFSNQELVDAGLDEMRRIIRETEPERPSTRLAKRTDATGETTLTADIRIDSDLDWIVLKCLEKDRTRRYDTAAGLAADIRHHLSNEPVAARPPSSAYKLRKTWQRNRLLFSAGIVVALVMVAGIAVSTWQAIRVTESQQHSRRLLYAADMNLAQQALKLNDLDKARGLLDRHRPQSGEEDLRDWEWRYLWQLTRSTALVTLTNRPVTGGAVSFSHDGTYLAAGWDDGHVELWDALGRRMARTLTNPECHHLARLAFSPVSNLLATTSEPGVVTLYDLDSGRESIAWRAPDPRNWDVRDLEFSPDGSRLAVYAGIVHQNVIPRAAAIDDAIWVWNVASARIENLLPAVYIENEYLGATQLSADNRRLYLPGADFVERHYRIRCVDLTTGRDLWRTEPQRDLGLSSLALSPDGRFLASASGFEDPTIRIWDAATGRLIAWLEGHTGWVCKLMFTKDGRRLISTSSDQSIRIWDTDTGNWREAQVLRGHTDQIQSVAISDANQLIASIAGDGNLILWKEKGTSAADGYLRLPADLHRGQVVSRDGSRALVLPQERPPELIDLKGGLPPMPLPGITASHDLLGWFGTNIYCHWNGTNQVLVSELRGTEFIPLGAVTMASGTRPPKVAYCVSRQLLAWADGTNSPVVYIESLKAPATPTELRSDLSGLLPLAFSEDGTYLVARTGSSSVAGGFVRAWNVETAKLAASVEGKVYELLPFAADGRMLVVSVETGRNHEIRFYDLADPARAPARAPWIGMPRSLAVSPDGRLAASPTRRGHVRWFDTATGTLIEAVAGHVNSTFDVAFSPNGRRLISTSGGRETVKIWDVSTRQELLTLDGIGSTLYGADWSADGDVILAGEPWQSWRAPSWEEIAAAEARENAQSGGRER